MQRAGTLLDSGAERLLLYDAAIFPFHWEQAILETVAHPAQLNVHAACRYS